MNASTAAAVRPRPGRLRPAYGLGARPDARELEFLGLLNQARANPGRYGSFVGVNLSRVPPREPLSANYLLVEAARAHSQDMADRLYFEHNTPEGIDPGRQITAAGFHWSSWGQSIAAGSGMTPAQALAQLVRDEEDPTHAHRRHLLGLDGVFVAQKLVGVGGVAGRDGIYYTVNTASALVSPAPEAARQDAAVYAERLYQTVVGRPPTQDELRTLAGDLLSLDGRLAAVRQLADSNEVRRNAVNSIHRELLGRPATQSEVNYFMSAMAHGIPEEEVQAKIIGGDEFARRADAVSGAPGERWVRAAFHAFLHRDPTEDEAERLSQEAESAPRGYCVLKMMREPEFRRAAIVHLYHRLDRGEPTEEEVKRWDESKLPLSVIRLNFMADDSLVGLEPRPGAPVPLRYTH